MEKYSAVIFDLGGVLVHIGGTFQGHAQDLITGDAAGLAFAQRQKAQGIRLLIFTNCGKGSLQDIRHKCPELFALFAACDIFTPDKIGFAKSEPAAFAVILAEAGLDAATTLFIDDSPANVQAARVLGIAAILHTDWVSTEREVQKFYIS